MPRANNVILLLRWKWRWWWLLLLLLLFCVPASLYCRNTFWRRQTKQQTKNKKQKKKKQKIDEKEISGKFVLSYTQGTFVWLNEDGKKYKRNETMNVLNRQGHWHCDVIEIIEIFSTSS
jgi:uncharacterized protein YpmS